MSNALEKLKAMDDGELRTHLLVCCSAAKWADQLAKEKPFGSQAELLQRSGDVWLTMEDSDLMEVGVTCVRCIDPVCEHVYLFGD